jgi:hypothetical protein
MLAMMRLLDGWEFLSGVVECICMDGLPFRWRILIDEIYDE